MSEQQLSITYVPDQAAAEQEAYFILLEAVERESDALSLADAANMVNAAYDIDPCEEADSETAADEETAEDAVPEDADLISRDEFADWIADNLDMSVCAVNADGSYNAQVKVFRSHQNIPYVLRLTNGESISTVVTEEVVSERIEIDGSSATLTYAYAGNLQCAHAVKSIKGSTVNFASEISGTISVKYTTRYDLVTIIVNGEDGEAGECTAIGFMSGYATDSIELSAPEKDDDTTEEEAAWYCSNPEITTPGDNVTCYKIVRRHTKCACSPDTIVDTETIEKVVPCPRQYKCPGAETTCRKLIGTESETKGYVVCDGDYTDKCGDMESAVELCCGKSPMLRPPCCKVTLAYSGGKSIDTAKYISTYGPNTRFVAVAPKKGICGTLTKTYEHDSCCEDVEDLTPAETNPSTISSGQSVLIAFGGGLGPFDWTISGGATFAGGATTATTLESRIRVYAPETLCRDVTISISGQCGSSSERLATDTEPVSLILLEDGLRYAIVRVEAGVIPYILTTTGTYTSFSAEETVRELELNGGGDITIFIEKEQMCEGDFEVIVSDACADVQSVTVPVDEFNTGVICCRYYTSYTSLVDWSNNGGAPLVSDNPRWVDTSTATVWTDSVVSGASTLPEGDYWVMRADSSRYISFVSIEEMESGYYQLSYTHYDDCTLVSEFCEVCA